MIKGIVEVSQIEKCASKQGEYIKLHYTDSKGPHKMAVFDKVQVALFKEPGNYYLEIDKPEGSEYWKLISAEKRGVASVTAGRSGGGNDRAILIGCAMKCTAQVLTGSPGHVVDMALTLMRAFVSAAEAIEQDLEQKKIQEATQGGSA